MVARATITIIVDDEDADLLVFQSNLRSPQQNITQKVASRFLGVRPNGYHTDHINNLWWDNRRSNLQYITRDENIRKTRKRGSLQLNQVLVWLENNPDKIALSARAISRIIKISHPTVHRAKVIFKALKK